MEEASVAAKYPPPKEGVEERVIGQHNGAPITWRRVVGYAYGKWEIWDTVRVQKERLTVYPVMTGQRVTYLPGDMPLDQISTFGQPSLDEILTPEYVADVIARVTK